MNRQSQLKDLENFIAEKQSRLDFLLNEFNWTADNVLKKFNGGSSNLTKNSSLSANLSDEPLFPESLNWENSVKIDNDKLDEITKQTKICETNKKVSVPDRFSDLQVNFNREEKLAMYDYVIQNTKKLKEPEMTISIETDEGTSKHQKQMTFAEIVSMKRDQKRRRQKYRTTKLPPLTQTEELRNLIELQMQALEQYSSVQKSSKTKIEETIHKKRLSSSSTNDDNMEKYRKKHKKQKHKSTSKSKKSHKNKAKKSHHRHHYKSNKNDSSKEKKKMKKSSSKDRN